MKVYFHDLALMPYETSNQTLARKYCEEIMSNKDKLIAKKCYEEMYHKGKKKGQYTLHLAMDLKEELEAEEKRKKEEKELSLCDGCWTMTKTIKGKCGKCRRKKK